MPTSFNPNVIIIWPLFSSFFDAGPPKKIGSKRNLDITRVFQVMHHRLGAHLLANRSTESAAKFSGRKIENGTLETTQRSQRPQSDRYGNKQASHTKKRPFIAQHFLI